MKKSFLILIIWMSTFISSSHAQCNGNISVTTKATSMCIVIYSNDVETIWNALRLANFSREAGDTVNIFLLGKGVDLDTIKNHYFNITEQTEMFVKSGGKILACGTCLQSRNISNPKVCTISTMSDLYALIRKNKIILTF